MYPQVFLQTFWQMELRPQIFVAMSFDPKYSQRFKAIIAPAIRSIPKGCCGRLFRAIPEPIFLKQATQS
jgi:hypothetical protein